MSVVSIVPREKENVPAENTIKTLSETDLLSGLDMNCIRGLAEELSDVFDKTQVFRTRTEMEVSVLNELKFPTPSSKYWQAVREQNVMFTELVMLAFEYRKTAIEVSILERDIPQEPDGFRQQLLQVDLDKHKFILKQHRRLAKARVRELKNWSEIKVREAMSMSEEELSSVDASQLVNYTKRWIMESLVMGGGGSPAERQNLLGQLRSGIKACIERGLIERVIEGFDSRVQEKIRKDYGV